MNQTCILITLQAWQTIFYPSNTDTMNALKISLVSSKDDNEFDDQLRKAFKSLFDLLNDSNKGQNFSNIDLVNFSYNDEPYIITKNTIASLTPAKYILSRKSIEDKVTPILAVKKANQQLPYFPAFFIAHKDSEIDSIHSEKIKRIYLVAKNSTSGYIIPLYELWKSGVINEPNEKGITGKKWEMALVGTQRDVETEIMNDKEAIGGTGQFTYQDEPEKCLVKPILRYDNLPQDLIVMSNNLLPYKDIVTGWFENIFKKDEAGRYLKEEGFILSESSRKITGVYKIDQEFKNALDSLEQKITQVNSHNNDSEQAPAITTIRTIKIFIASSAELTSDREDFRNFISVINDGLHDQGIYLKIIQWEYFLDSISETRKQDDYNKAVISADIFLSLFFTKVGKFSNEEFENAYGHFINNGTPKIFTYFKNAPVNIGELNRKDFDSLCDFKDKLNAINHFPSTYRNMDDLQNQFRIQLELLLRQ